MNKFLYVPLLLATFGATDVALAQTPAASQEAGKVTAGATVLDPKGGTVGTIKEISGEFAVLATDAVEVRLPLSSFAVGPKGPIRSEEHTSELQSLMRISYAVFCLKKK